MAKTACPCGVSLWNGYAPGGINWDIYPRQKAEEVIKKHPEYDITEVSDSIYRDENWPDFWLCRRCRRIKIWDQNDKYVSYKKVLFSEKVTVEEIFQMEEWLAYSDWDCEEEKTVAEALLHPFRPHRYFLSPDQQKIYVFNTEREEIEFVYQEECRELDGDLFRNENGLFRYRYENKCYVGAFYLDGREVIEHDRNGWLSDAVYGAIIGDALGVPFQHKERGSFVCTGMTGYGIHDQPPGTWSNLSSLILATCKSIQESNGNIIMEDLCQKYREWLFDGRFTPFGIVFDAENTTKTAIITGQSQDSRSDGGDALLRILPLAFTACSDDDIRDIAAITHEHEIVTKACLILINIIKERQTKRSFIKDIVHDLRLEAPFDRLDQIDKLRKKDIDSSGDVVSVLEAALWCVLTSRDYTDCLLKAVNLGGETNTIAALAGALGSLKFSFDDFPDPWVNEIKNNDLIQDCLF